MSNKVCECVPNFSEGRDKSIIDAIALAVKSVSGATLLDVDPGADTNRTVYTFVGDPDAVLEAAFKAAETAYKLIDMSKHSGAHPRMGALDVCPFIPVANMTMDECVALSKRFAERLATELKVPVYLYEYSASNPSHKNLADIRSGEYEGLKEKLQKPEWKPDFGKTDFVSNWGATVTGAREFLIAYNVNLNTRDKKLANEVALTIREGGRAKKDANGTIVKDAQGNTVKVPGLLKDVRAIGWYIDTYRCAQISINLISYKNTPLHVVFETAKQEAKKLGLMATGSELVGLVPLEPLLEAGKYYLTKQGKSPGVSEAELIECAVQSLGLATLQPFDAEKKIIDYAIKREEKLASMTVKAFVDEVSSESPAPGGGSVAALSGSLSAALAAMVANLTIGKKGYEAEYDGMRTLSVKAQEIKAALVRAIDADTLAFNDLMDAMKLPKTLPSEIEVRNKKMQEGYKKATLVPLSSARLCINALELCLDAAKKGNINSISDAGVGALMALAGVEGSVLNVLINLKDIQDEAFKDEMRLEGKNLREKANKIKTEVLDFINTKL